MTIHYKCQLTRLPLPLPKRNLACNRRVLMAFENSYRIPMGAAQCQFHTVQFTYLITDRPTHTHTHIHTRLRTHIHTHAYIYTERSAYRNPFEILSNVKRDAASLMRIFLLPRGTELSHRVEMIAVAACHETPNRSGRPPLFCSAIF